MTDAGMATGGPPPRRWKVWHFILIGLGALALLGAVLYFILSSVLTPIVASGDEFMTALKNGDYERARSLTTPALREELGSAQQLAQTASGYRPDSWSWGQRRMRNGVGLLDGSTIYQGGRIGTVRLTLNEVDGQWRVASFSLN
jgi:hypothetical protein